MVSDNPNDIKIYNNARNETILDITKNLISILYKYIDDPKIRNDIFKEFLNKYPEMNELYRFIH